MHVQSTHTCLGGRENVPLHTCQRINEHAKNPKPHRGSSAVEAEPRSISGGSLQSLAARRRMRTDLLKRLLRCVVNMRVYVFMSVGARVLCHSRSISSGPRVISVLNRTLLRLWLPSLYLISFSLLLLLFSRPPYKNFLKQTAKGRIEARVGRDEKTLTSIINKLF